MHFKLLLLFDCKNTKLLNSYGRKNRLEIYNVICKNVLNKYLPCKNLLIKLKSNDFYISLFK